TVARRREHPPRSPAVRRAATRRANRCSRIRTSTRAAGWSSTPSLRLHARTLERLVSPTPPGYREEAQANLAPLPGYREEAQARLAPLPGYREMCEQLLVNSRHYASCGAGHPHRAQLGFFQRPRNDVQALNEMQHGALPTDRQRSGIGHRVALQL